ncbi:MAG: carboxypeptidase regulatory-like domain-containing protein [Eggerthellaceae bacterium]|nr:carboxypeptidase regulatory-like domain-containing protein [Eggerthellaceae bacterium]
MAKVFLIDLKKCNGCRNCQIGCKDEHCGNTWLPYAAEQPDTGQFWCNVNEYERGGGSHVRVAYIPVLGAQNEAIREYAPEVLMEREDGLIVIDPEKAKGREDVAEKFEGVYWNAELQIPQGCTGCAHLLDDEDSPIRIPRCVDNCAVEAIQFGEESELDLEGAEPLNDQQGGRTIVYYKGLPQTFIAATVYDPDAMEIVEGAKVTAVSAEGTYEATTDMWGDFWLKEIPAGEYKVTIEKDGKVKELDVSTLEKDQGLPDIALA